MINKKLIYRVLGFLLYLETLLLFLCAGVSVLHPEDKTCSLGKATGNVADDFLLTAAITIGAGTFLILCGRDTVHKINRRDGYILVTFSWLLFSFFGLMPYWFSGYIPSFSDAFFETMSGFTTTGASILNDIESLPHGLLFWRSMTQWIGGLGIIFFTIAVLPILGVGGVQLFAAEATGVTRNKVNPRVGVTARWIWSIYLGLTLSESLFLMFGGMSFFDSICHAFTTTSTGGYSTMQGSIAAYNSPYIEYVATVFMFLSGINFTLLFLLFRKGQIKTFLRDIELRTYFYIVLFLTSIITLVLYFNDYLDSFELTFRKAIFQVVSILTTTGYVTDDYMNWTPFLWTLIAFIMFMGACAGSTTGALKTIRLVILHKIARNEFKRIIHPNAILPVRLNQTVLNKQQKSTILAFTFIYILIVIISWLAFVAMGLNFDAAFGVVASSIGNVGPGIGNFGPSTSWSHLPELAKWWASALMLIGRLEIFSVLIVFSSSLWKTR
jgi:trk system potassium uptake protein TrkH